MIDVVIVGSGASAVNAAWPLVESGLRVVMIDVGQKDETYGSLIPAAPFEEIRSQDEGQHRYFLGDNFEGIPFGPIRVGAQLTPPRKYISEFADYLLPKTTEDFLAMESLAYGGLAAGWGAACFPFQDEEIPDWPLKRRELQQHYDAVTQRIGICGSQKDALKKIQGPVANLLDKAQMDDNAKYLYQRYIKKRKSLKKRGFVAGNPWLAMTTKPLRGRGAVKYLDMDFWADGDQSVYRPKYTVEEMKRRYLNFEYRPGLLAIQFSENEKEVELVTRELGSNGIHRFHARNLILAAGTLGTTRLVMHSEKAFGRRLPLVSNPYVYYPCLNLNAIGKRLKNDRHSLTQLTAFFDFKKDPTRRLSAQFYSYRSLLTFKLMKESPLPFPESRLLMQYLQPYLMIAGIHHPDGPNSNKSVWLEEPSRAEGLSNLHVSWNNSEKEISSHLEAEAALRKIFRKLRIFPLKRLHPGNGSSIHYAGSLPMSESPRPFTCNRNGLLHGKEKIYIADGATFPSLPAKGLTFTLMANADRIGKFLAGRLKKSSV